jgi:hypothetical protein
LFIAPLAWLPVLAVHFLALVGLTVAAYKKQKPHLIPVVAFSYPFMVLMSNTNVEWMVMLGTVSIGYIPAILLSLKPQVAALALMVYLRPNRLRYLVPLAALAIAGALLWRWPFVLLDNSPADAAWNISMARYTWPVGVYGAWRAWRDSSMLWGCVASLAVAPYFSAASLVPVLFLVADKNATIGVALSVVSWCVVAG